MIIVEPDVWVFKPDGLVLEPEIEVVEAALDRMEAGRVTFVDMFLPRMFVGWLGRGYMGFERVGYIWTLMRVTCV